jgi:hypothetical protein
MAKRLLITLLRRGGDGVYPYQGPLILQAGHDDSNPLISILSSA